MNAKKKILFLCTHNAARSQIAEGFINARYGDRYEAFSAGNEPTVVHACAVKVMAEEGINISKHRAKSLDEFRDVSFDYVVALCTDIAESCPIFPGGVTYLHQPFDDPAVVEGSGLEKCERFRNVRDQIREWIEATFSQAFRSLSTPTDGSGE